ncbi:MAG TPA: NUDIX domain-containing protein [Vicinamibacteria bacterium]|nr:NUDIX domain-containing protein [Vicinamibacteria bacterium]
MPKLSAGLLMYRHGKGVEVFIVHPGGPFFRNKDEGSWSLPKGEIELGGDALATAQREFREETGLPAPESGLIPLGEVQQKGGKRILAWAFEGDCNPSAIRSNTFTIEWPPRSGREQAFPEIDRADFFPADVARRKLNPAQSELVDRLLEHLARCGED